MKSNTNVHFDVKLFKDQFEKIKELRKTLSAPVDTFGCERLADKTASPRDFRFQTLVALMLSSQTRDEVTAAAFNALRTCFSLFNAQSLANASIDHINSCIKQVGFHRRKSTYLQQTSQILVSQYDSDIPHTVNELTKLPGVGPKMVLFPWLD